MGIWVVLGLLFFIYSPRHPLAFYSPKKSVLCLEGKNLDHMIDFWIPTAQSKARHIVGGQCLMMGPIVLHSISPVT